MCIVVCVLENMEVSKATQESTHTIEVNNCWFNGIYIYLYATKVVDEPIARMVKQFNIVSMAWLRRSLVEILWYLNHSLASYW